MSCIMAKILFKGKCQKKILKNIPKIHSACRNVPDVRSLLRSREYSQQPTKNTCVIELSAVSANHKNNVQLFFLLSC